MGSMFDYRRPRGGDGAAVAAFAGIVGTAIAASQDRRAYYDGYYSGGLYYGGYGGSGVPTFRGHPLADW